MPNIKFKLLLTFLLSFILLALSSLYAVFFTDRISLIFILILLLFIFIIVAALNILYETTKKPFKNLAGTAKGTESFEKKQGEIKSIVSSAEKGLMIIDDDDKIIMANEIAENILKMPSQKLLGKNIKEVLLALKDKKDLSADKWPLEKAIKDKRPNEINKKTFNGAVIVFEDIAELKKLEEEREFAKYNAESILRSVYVERDNVQEGKNKLEATLNSIGDAVLAVWEDKRIVILNPIAEKISGFSFKEAENKNYKGFFKFIKEETKEEVDIIDLAFNSGDRITRSDLALLNKNKGLVSIDISAALIKDQDDKRMGIIIVLKRNGKDALGFYFNRFPPAPDSPFRDKMVY